MLIATTPPLALQEQPGAQPGIRHRKEMKPHMTNRGLQGGAFRKDTTPERCRRRSEDQSFPWSSTTGSESHDDTFKKGTSFAVVGLFEDRTGFHPGQHSSPPNATPQLPRRPHGHGHRAAPSHGLCSKAQQYHHQGRRPGIQDLDTTSPEIRHYPSQRDERKGPTFHTPGQPPTPRPNRPAKAVLHRLVLQHRARDELGPTAPCAK